MQRRRIIFLALAALICAASIASGPHRASLNILVADRNDPSPRTLDAKVELVGVAVSLLIRWSAGKAMLR